MRSDLCAEFFMHADQDDLAGIGKSPPKFVKWLEKQDLPVLLFRLLCHYWPQKQTCQIGTLAFYTAKDVHDDCWQPQCLKQRLLTIGYAPNGDYLVIRLDTDECEVGFISHEEWDHEGDFQEYYQPLAKSLESLLYRLIENKFVPCDYFAAKDYNSLLEEERKA